jgi:MFS family permease
VTRLRRYLRTFTGFQRDARLYLVGTLVSGVAISLYWVDFNLYLASLGLERPTIGIIATAGSLAGVLVAFPAALLSDRIGRRRVMIAGFVVMLVALVGFLLASAVPALLLFALAWGAGQQTLFVVTNPFLTEHSSREHRDELFSLQFAISNVTNIGAALLGGAVAWLLEGVLGFGANGVETYRVILVIMGVSLAAGLAVVTLLGDDHPSRIHPRHLLAVGEPAAFPAPGARRTRAARIGVRIEDPGRFVRLVLPGFLISIGAGQLIPFLNLFVQGKFGLDLASLNAVFAFASLGTTLAILLQPAIARRFGRIGSVVLVQGASIPFLVVLGFSPLLWSVVLAMAVRNSLMNAGNPIVNAFAMDYVSPAERATVSAAMSQLWSLGWVIAAPWYSILQATLGFERGYAVNFVTTIVLYGVGTALYWIWFRDAESRPVRGTLEAA